jgi:hypothetical protein
MAGPASQQNSASQAVDTLYGTDGVGRVKRGLGDYALSGVTPVGTAHLVGTHLPDTAYDAADPVVLTAAVDDWGDVVPLRLDAAGRLPVLVDGLPLIPNVFKSFSAVDISYETTIWAPASGMRFRLMGFVITQGTVTGDITLRDNTYGSTILVIPATPVGQPLYVPLGNGILAAVGDNVLTAEGVSTEVISGFVFGTEE